MAAVPGKGKGGAGDPDVVIVDGPVDEAAEERRRREILTAPDYYRGELDNHRLGVSRANARVERARSRLAEDEAKVVAAQQDVDRLENLLAEAEAAAAALEG